MKIWYQSAVEIDRAGAYGDALNAHFQKIAASTTEGILAEVVATNGLTDIDGATVVDPIGTAIAFAEMQVKLHKLAGMRPGRKWHYAKPDQAIIDGIRAKTETY